MLSIVQDKMKRDKYYCLMRIQEVGLKAEGGSYASADNKGGHNDGPTPSTAAQSMYQVPLDSTLRRVQQGVSRLEQMLRRKALKSFWDPLV